MKKFGDTLFPFRPVAEMDLHQNRMLALTLTAANHDFVFWHVLPCIILTRNCNA